jgi:hypothetical protein
LAELQDIAPSPFKITKAHLASPLPVPVSPSGPISLVFQTDRSGERLAGNVHLAAVVRFQRATGTGRKETIGEKMLKTRLSRELR